MIDEYKFIEYVRKQEIILIENNQDCSIDGIIERFKEVLKEQIKQEKRCLINGCQKFIKCGFCGGCEEHHIINLEKNNCECQKEMEKDKYYETPQDAKETMASIDKENFKELKEENKNLRNSLDNCFQIDEVENTDIWEKIGLLIDNEIEQEKHSNQ